MKQTAPVTDAERRALLAATVLLLAGCAATMWRHDLWWCVIPAMLLMVTVMTVRGVRCWRVGDHENAAMAAWTVCVALLAVAGILTGWIAVWAALAVVGGCGVGALLYQARRDRREFAEWQRRWAAPHQRPEGWRG